MSWQDSSLQHIFLEADTRLEHMCRLDFQAPCEYRRLTGFVCTIGKASRSVGILKELILAGMNIVRMNFSYESHEAHLETIQNVREAAASVSKELGYNVQVALALETRGPRIRTGMIENFTNEVELRANEFIRLSINRDLMEKGNRECVYVDYENIINVIQAGNKILIEEIVLIVKEVAVDCVICLIETGGILGSKRNVILQGIFIDLPAVSEKDRFDMKFGIDNRVDMIFAGGIRNPAALRDIRTVLGDKGRNIKIITKIENLQILSQLDEIIEASDGILFARGDCAIEVNVEKVFLLQKALFSLCNRAGKPVICSTHILESMRDKPRPTRSEVFDLGNVVLDGADCIMLTAETAVGKYPLETLTTAATICKEAEAVLWYRHLFEDLVARNPSIIDASHAVAIAAVDASKKALASAIVVLTVSGRSASLVSKYRPRCPIFMVTRCGRAARQGHLHRGIIPVFYTEQALPDWADEVEARIQFALSVARKRTLVSMGDAVIVLSPWKDGPGFTNNLRVVYAFYENEKMDCILSKDKVVDMDKVRRSTNKKKSVV